MFRFRSREVQPDPPVASASGLALACALLVACASSGCLSPDWQLKPPEDLFQLARDKPGTETKDKPETKDGQAKPEDGQADPEDEPTKPDEEEELPPGVKSDPGDEPAIPEEEVEEPEEEEEAVEEAPAADPISEDPDDPGNAIEGIRKRHRERQSVLFPTTPTPIHDAVERSRDRLYQATSLRLGLALTHLFQYTSETPLSDDDNGNATTLDLHASWDVLAQDEPTRGHVVARLQGRWDYGTTAPGTLATDSLGSLLGTANTFNPYSPAFLLRDLYWQQGSEEAGWAYRVGKITPDALIGNSRHIGAGITFLPNAGVRPFSAAIADSGLGIAGTWFFNNRLKVTGMVSDANADRTDFGDVDEGDFFQALEVGYKVAPLTRDAGYSKLAVWHTSGTEDGDSSNANLGPDGWGFFLKHEQELTRDGRAIGILRYGKSFEDAATYDQQAGANLLFYEPAGPGRLANDLLGIGFNWVEPTQVESHNEYNVEVFYRVPIVPLVDMTLSYQSVFNPSLAPDTDHASVFSIRFRTTF